MVVSKQAQAAVHSQRVRRQFWRLLAVVGMSAALAGAVTVNEAAAQAAQGSGSSKARLEKKSKQTAKPGGDSETSPEATAADAAQKAYELGLKLAQAGKHEAAVLQFNSALQGGKLPTSVMARALYHRGIAHRKLGRAVQAIADLTSASWLKGGLSDSEKSDALAQRAEAYKEAGIAQQSGERMSAGTATPTTTPSAPLPWSTDTQPGRNKSSSTGATTPTVAAASSEARPAPPSQVTSSGSAPEAQSGSASFGAFFGSLFSGSSAQTDDADTPAGRVSTSATRAAAPTTSVSAWSQGTEVANGKAPGKSTASAVPVATAAATAPSGKYRLQVATVRSRNEAKAIAQRVKQRHAGTIGAREPAVDETVVGNMGTFYQVSVGPFSDPKEPQAMCGRFRSDGLDCHVTSQ